MKLYSDHAYAAGGTLSRSGTSSRLSSAAEPDCVLTSLEPSYALLSPLLGGDFAKNFGRKSRSLVSGPDIGGMSVTRRDSLRTAVAKKRIRREIKLLFLGVGLGYWWGLGRGSPFQCSHGLGIGIGRFEAAAAAVVKAKHGQGGMKEFTAWFCQNSQKSGIRAPAGPDK
ncbi:ZWICHEL kinesin-like calmodulin-binding protein [Prunus dulcis]|uniref:ZWICHEL kinesin-like calmodulin-binding protein n=1 Tax=Prunus dulcis TaxID=3755 RepID=A0A4Y1QPN0_PRUDU|nr:ZWICHEL kinesin-like calmodulin-binding protein [Prunus dulcis]